MSVEKIADSLEAITSVAAKIVGDPEPAQAAVQAQAVLVTHNGFETHPEAYYKRVFVHVAENGTYYELLKSGEAIPWTANPSMNGFDFWIIDVDRLSDFGMYRAR